MRTDGGMTYNFFGVHPGAEERTPENGPTEREEPQLPLARPRFARLDVLWNERIK
jgi:hypothetical protein